MVYCALGFGNNFFYPFGTESLPIPSHLLDHDGDSEGTSDQAPISGTDCIIEEGSDDSGENDNENGANKDDDSNNHEHSGDDNDAHPKNGESTVDPHKKNHSAGTTCVNLIPIAPGVKHLVGKEDGEDDTTTHSSSASNWLRSRLVLDHQQSNGSSSLATTTEYSSTTLPLTTCGATHTTFILPPPSSSSSSKTKSPAGEAHIVGTIFGHTFPKLTVQPSRLPLRIVRVSSGRRHVLALTEGAAPLAGSGGGGSGIGRSGSGGSGGGGFGGGVVMSWGAGHFGQLGHGPDVTSCLEPRIVERLLPHVVGGQVIEIAAGGLHSAAIVASSSTKTQKIIPSDNSNEPAIVIRETRTFAWGSNRKGQCGIDGGKCATVPAPLPVVTVKRAEASSSSSSSRRDSSSGGSKTAPVDKVVHFEKLALGRVHTVALTAYGEVFSWGSTSMGRCGHSMESGRGISADRRICQEPRFVAALRNVAIESIAAGDAHTLALSKGGRVFAWGAGADGQCGQGHMGNLFSPRAVQQAHFSEGFKGVDVEREMTSRKNTQENGASGDSGESSSSEDGGNEIPRVNSKVAMEVAMEEEAISKQLAMSQTVTPKEEITPEPPKDVKIATIRASGCLSAAITSCGAVYTWGYAGGAAMGHPVPSPNSNLPLLPLIEGNQFSSVTAAKVYPEGGSEENVIRDCRAFDTDLNVMLPRKVECLDKLGLVAEDLSLGPDHMVILCSTSGSPGDNIVINDSRTGQALHNETKQNGHRPKDETHQNAGNDQTSASESAEGLSSLTDAYSGTARGMTAVSTNSTFGDVSTVATFESADTSEYSRNEKRRSSHGWMTKIRSSRLSNKSLTNEPHLDGSGRSEPSPTGARDKEKKKSFLHVGKLLDVAFHRSGK